MKEFKPAPAKPAPIDAVGPIHWLKENLFSSVFNSVLTLSLLAFLVSVIPGFIDWSIISANWVGETQADCTNKVTACWVFVSQWMQQFFYGSYPEDEIWRVNTCMLVLLIVIIAPYFLPKKIRNMIGIPLFLVFPFFAAILLDGRLLGLQHVSSDNFGGFSLNVLLAAASIIIAFPLSFLWALGRLSNMPIIRSVSIIFIEFFRGVPVLALFFMASNMLPLFFPSGFDIDKIACVWIILVFFMSGYMAEVFRGGFQAIPQGQYEAADAIGLGYWQKMLLIMLPQVIKVSMPNILATFVMLFKNTTFLYIISIPEMLGSIQFGLNNSAWSSGSNAVEGYLFMALVFWICCFSMSMIATSIEKKLDTGHKN